MTREERALRNLKQMYSDGRYLGSGSHIPLEVLEDFSTAIKALEQEPIKPMVEIDLYSVIKQKYIEREVLDKIYADIQRLRGCSCSCSDGIIDDIEDIIDKYKAETEST